MEIEKSLKVVNNTYEIEVVFNIGGFTLALNTIALKDVNWIKFIENNYHYTRITFSDTIYIEIEKIDALISFKGKSFFEFEFEILFSEIEGEFLKLCEWQKTFLNF
jgi:hypothetical protein